MAKNRIYELKVSALLYYYDDPKKNKTRLPFHIYSRQQFQNKQCYTYKHTAIVLI